MLVILPDLSFFVLLVTVCFETSSSSTTLVAASFPPLNSSWKQLGPVVTLQVGAATGLT